MEKPVFIKKDEAELIDLLNIIWKRKWLILIPTILCMILAGTISFLLPQKWEVDAILLPSKVLIETGQGRYEEVVFVNPKQIVSQINSSTYNKLISTDLKLEIRNLANIKAENIRDTNLVRFFLREKDIEKGKLILNSLYNHLKEDSDKKANIEIQGIMTQIKSNEIEKSKLEKEIKVNKNKINIINQRKKEIEKEIKDIKKRIEVLENEQRVGLKKENRSETESLAMLLYSNEIQQSLMNYGTLNELLSSKKIEEEDINLTIQDKEERIKQIENDIDNLNEKKGRIDNTQLLKEPTSSFSPVFPKKFLIVFTACILGLIIFTFLSFIFEYLEKQKLKS